MSTKLSPTQQRIYEGLCHALPIGSIFVVYGETGMGKTTILQQLHRTTSGVLLNMREFMAAMRDQSPFAIEETFERMILDALNAHDTVLLDDLHLVNDVVCGCGFNFYPRPKLINAPIMTLVTQAANAGKKLIFGLRDSAPPAIRQRSYGYNIEKFGPDDYAFLCAAFLPNAKTAKLDYAKIHRFAPKLNAHQLKSACLYLAREQNLSTERFIDYLRSQRMASNVDLEEVQQVDLHDLKGVDDVIEKLEANIILPLENDELATELNIKPKRGVLLAGPPGTGKTTIGRALAHRLKSKFFLIDGTIITGTREFYGRIQQVFEEAKQNAPSIIFIDDSDVIFENQEQMGLYRYLLTMLDGLESESAGRVCVMMTAMNVAHLPPALIRSGRIELWLETRLPDETARAEILRAQVARLPKALQQVDVERLAADTEGLTGADLKRLIEDGKILFAYDRAQGMALRSPTHYFQQAIDTVRANKQIYAQAEAMAQQRHSRRPPWFDIADMMPHHVEIISSENE